nr:2-amino-4-hydroxy-6-hydroxymethyldihydropteridine diphosphokinase [Aliiruegeria haliotis]
MTRHKSDTKALVALGSNLAGPAGPPALTLRTAIDEIVCADVEVLAASRIFATPCMPAGAGPDYANAAVLLRTRLTASALLSHLHEIENRHERTRQQRWGARTLDLDLLDHGLKVVPDIDVWQHWYDLPTEQQRTIAPDRLVLPHPRIQDRAFVLVPLLDICPDWIHPVLGRSVREMCAALTEADLTGILPKEPPESLALSDKGR